MLKNIGLAFAVYVVLSSLPAMAQKRRFGELPTPPVPAACGDMRAKFEVKPSKNAQTAQLETGKALVYFVEEDTNTQWVTHTGRSRIGIDGKWMGATYGSSYFSFPVDPGVHHLCATTQIGIATNDVVTALAHFTAEAGSVYDFEVKNISMRDTSIIYSDDATLLPIDIDEGKYLTSWFPLVESHQKK
jgi:hypothetical protein